MWLRTFSDHDGRIYGPGYFTNLDPFRKTLVGPYGQKTQRRLILLERCYCCGVFVEFTEDGQGDHLIPKSAGGDLDLINFAPMCARCNSSKGNLDLPYWWWAKKGKTLLDLNPDVTVVYARGKYRQLLERGTLEEQPDAATELLLGHFATTLPTQAHTDAFKTIPAKAGLGW